MTVGRRSVGFGFVASRGASWNDKVFSTVHRLWRTGNGKGNCANCVAGDVEEERRQAVDRVVLAGRDV